MEKFVARLVSIIFHPLFIPTYLYIILLHLPVYFSLVLPTEIRWLIIGMIFITTGILPSLFIFFLFKRGLVASLNLETKEERTFPYLISVVFYYLAYYLLRRLQLSPFLYYIMAGTAFLVILVLVINLFWKISSHTTAIGALLGTIIGTSYFLEMYLINWILLITLISGLVGFARLKENAHSPLQVYAGFVVGFAVMCLLFLIQ